MFAVKLSAYFPKVLVRDNCIGFTQKDAIKLKRQDGDIIKFLFPDQVDGDSDVENGGNNFIVIDEEGNLKSGGPLSEYVDNPDAFTVTIEKSTDNYNDKTGTYYVQLLKVCFFRECSLFM